MKFEISIEGPQHAVSKLIKNLQNGIPSGGISTKFAAGNHNRARILLRKDEEDLDDTLTLISKAVHALS